MLCCFGRRDQTAQVTELGSTLIILPEFTKYTSLRKVCGGSLALGHSGRRRRHRQVPVTALLPAADGDAVPCHCRAQRTRRSCFEALLETSAVLVLAPLMAAVARDPDATNEARSLTVVTVRVLYRVIG